MWTQASWISLPSAMPCGLVAPQIGNSLSELRSRQSAIGTSDHKRDCAAGADDFLPVLIYVVIHANPPQLASNLEYIQRFRMHSRMASESAYFFTQLVCPVSLLLHPHHATACVPDYSCMEGRSCAGGPRLSSMPTSGVACEDARALPCSTLRRPLSRP